MPSGFGSFTAFESADDRFLREIEQALQRIELPSGDSGEHDPDLPERISEIRRRAERYRRLSGRSTLALERLWSIAGLFFGRARWKSWEVAEMTDPSWPGPEPWEAWARGLFGALLVGSCLIFAFFGSRWFLLPAVLLALTTGLVVWLPLERSRLLGSLRSAHR
jgi:hypothetical protein